MKQTRSPANERLPFSRVLWLAWSLPWRPTRAMKVLDPCSPHRPRCGVLAAWLIHLMWIGVGIGIMYLCGVTSSVPANGGLRVWFKNFFAGFGSLFQELGELINTVGLLTVLGGFALYVAMFHALLFLTAFGSISWVSHGETLGDRILIALRRHYLLGGGLLWLALIFGLPTILLIRANDVWRQSNSWYGGDLPWYIVYQEEVTIGLFVAGALASVIVIHRGLSAGIGVPRCRWPAVCQRCGYGLYGMTKEQACPECGLSAERAMGTQRDGPASALWHSASWPGRVARLCLGPIYHYATWGQSLRQHDPDPAWRWVLPAHAVAAVPIGIGLGTLTGLFEMVFGRWRFGVIAQQYDADFVVYGLIYGGTWGIAMIVGTVLISSSFGMMASWFFKTNLYTPAAQAGAYLGFLGNIGFVMIWIAVVLGGVLDDLRVLRWIEDELYIDEPMSLMGVIVLMIGPVIYRYVWCLSKITLGMRHSTR